jgi:quercetin dioxygenase-like cupin family protein
MTIFRRGATAAVIAAQLLFMQIGLAQQSGFGRTDVLRRDLGIDGREIIQTRVDFAPGVVSPRHSHPGEEIAYVLEGTLEYEVEGQAPVTLKAGEALFIPAGANHIARNVGGAKATELATYIVSRGKPLLVIAK